MPIIKLNINNASETIQSKEIEHNKKQTLKVKANDNYAYHIEGLATDNALQFKKQGKDLLIELDGDNDADILIEDYYSYPESQVIVSTSADTFVVYDVSVLAESTAYQVVDSVATQTTPWWVSASAASTTGLSGMSMLGGLLGVGVVASALGGGGSSSSDAAPENQKGRVEIVGQKKQGGTLTAKVSDADGMTPDTDISYQWKRSGEDIAGATEEQYTLTQEDVGKELTVVVKYADGRQFKETVTQAAGTVENVNDAPVAENTEIQGNEDTEITGSLPKANDIDGDNVTYSLAKTAENGIVTVKADGTYSYTPNENYNGTDSFEYQVDDGKGGKNTYTVSVTVDAVNDVPVAKDDTADVTLKWQSELTSNSLQTGLGGDNGFGEASVVPEQSKNQSIVDISSVFPDGMKLGDKSYHIIKVDGNGKVSFHTSTDDANRKISESSLPPTLLPFYSSMNAATGKVWYDLDADKGIVTITWDNVTPVGIQIPANAPTNSFQVQLINQGNGDIDIRYIYGDMQWFNASYGSYYPADIEPTIGWYINGGNNQQLPLTQKTITTASNVGTAGVFNFHVRGGKVVDFDTKPITIDVLANDVDADNDALTITKASLSDGSGEVSIVDNKLVYTPDNQAILNGKTVTLTYTVTDGKGKASTANVVVKVNSDYKNSTPTTDDVTVETSGKYTFTLKDFPFTDVELHSVQAIIVKSLPEKGRLTLVDEAVSVGQVIAVNDVSKLVFTPDATDNGVTATYATFDFAIQDTGGVANGSVDTSQTHTVTIDLSNKNHAPTSENTTIKGTEDTLYTFSKSDFVFADNADGHGFKAITGLSTYSGTLMFDGKVVTTETVISVNDIGKLTYLPAQDKHVGTVYFKVQDNGGTANDGSDTSTTYVLFFEGTPVNDAPTASDANLNAVTNVARDGELPPATDVDGDKLTYSLAKEAENGTVTVNTDGSYQYTAKAGFTGTDTFTYNVDDGKGGTAKATATVTVRADNALPVASDMRLETAEDNSLYGQLPKATDADNDTVIYSQVEQPKHGSVEISQDGSYQYKPSENYHGKDSFTYKVDDGFGGTNTYTVNVTVTPVNDAPEVSYSDREKVEQVITGNELSGKLPEATDADGDDITYVMDKAAENGTATVNADGTYTYIPKANFIGQDTFAYSVSDGKGGSNSYTVKVNVRPEVNSVPVGADADITVREDSVMGYEDLPKKATDADGDKLTYSIVKGAEHGSASVNDDGQYYYDPKSNYHGTDSFTYKVDDGFGGTNTYTVNVTVTPVNDAPEISSYDDQNKVEQIITGNELSGKLPEATDADGDDITYAVDKAADNGTATVKADGTYTYTPKADFIGQDIFTYSVSDGKGGSNSYTVKVNVRPEVNSVPVGADADITVSEDSSMGYADLPQKATDADGDKLTYSLVKAAEHGSAYVNDDGQYYYNPNSNFNGKDSFTYKVDDGFGGTNTYTVNVTVTPVNDVPEVSYSDQEKVEQVVTGNTLLGKLPEATDIDGDNLTYAVDYSASNGTAIVKPDGSYTYTPKEGFLGKDSFVYSVNDGNGGSNSYKLNINVRPEVNNLPVGSDVNVTTKEDNSILAELPKATDADGDELTYSLETQSEHGQVYVFSNGRYNYQPNSNYHGKDSFTYKVDDGFGGTKIYTVNVNVTSVNDVPEISGYSNQQKTEQITIGNELSGKLPEATDADGDDITYAVDKAASNGTAIVNEDGTYTYTPKVDFIGQDTFTYSVSDGKGGSNTYTVKVNVRPEVNSLPVGADLGVTTKEDQGVWNGQLPKASDSDGDNLIYSIVKGPEHGSAYVYENGQYYYDPSTNYHGKDSFTYKVDDGFGGTNTYTVNVTVTPVNDAPEVSYSDQEKVEQVITGNELSGKLPEATDSDGDDITYAVDKAAENGTANVNADGTYTYTPKANFIGQDTFTYSVSDGKGGSNTYTVKVNVRPEVNSVPVGADAEITVSEDSVMGYEDLPQKATDADGDKLTYTIVKGAEHGSSYVSDDGQYYYDPYSNYHGKDSFTYKVDDGFGGTNTYTVNVIVTSVNDVPEVNVYTAGDAEYKVGGDAIKIASESTIYDVEANQQSSYDGMVLSVAQQSGADTNDVFGTSGSLVFNDGKASYAGVSVGDVINESGKLRITFNENATQELIENTAESITYKSNSDAAGSHTLVWQFAESSASNALTGTFEQTVNIIA